MKPKRTWRRASQLIAGIVGVCWAETIILGAWLQWTRAAFVFAGIGLFVTWLRTTIDSEIDREIRAEVSRRIADYRGTNSAMTGKRGSE